MNENLNATMDEASDKLAADLTKIFAPLEARMLPDALVESLYSYNMAEDGKTLLVMVDLTDGSTVMIGIAPGARITCHAV